MTDKEFWQRAYIAALGQAGCNKVALIMADQALSDYKRTWVTADG